MNQLEIRVKSAPTGVAAGTVAPDILGAAELILSQYGARTVSYLSSPRLMPDGKMIPARMSANDAYSALEEACIKMARVAVRHYSSHASLQLYSFATAVGKIFPDPVAYLARAIRSVLSDEGRAARHEVPTVSLDQPLSTLGDNAICLRDTLADPSSDSRPEEALIEQDEKAEFRAALSKAMEQLSPSYYSALQLDLERERRRERGEAVGPETDRERQNVCRARAALARLVARQCGSENVYSQIIAQPRVSRPTSKVRRNTGWNVDRQARLFERILQYTWQQRAACSEGDSPDVEEAIINEVNAPRTQEPPTPEMRRMMRVMDTYTLDDNPCAGDAAAQMLYDSARRERRAGNLEAAIKLYREAHDVQPAFYAALNEAGVLLMQLGRLREALELFLTIIDRPDSGAERYIAATNAADIYLTWYDSGRNRDRNIERATLYARMAMQRPSPMRASNLILAYVKDRYYIEARGVLEAMVSNDTAQCPAQKLLQTLAQIRDSDLIAWWYWLEEELGKEQSL